MSSQDKKRGDLVASSRVKSWAIVLEWERPNGTWYTETKTDIPNRVSGQIDDYITELEDEKKELVKRLKMVNKCNQKFIVNPMHGKVTRETFKEVVTGHTSFHLKQFGVL